MKRGLNNKTIIFLSLIFVSFVLLINNTGAIIVDSWEGDPCPSTRDDYCPIPESLCSHACIQYEDGSLRWGACTALGGYSSSENTNQLCSNGFDDDCDGLIDCEDLDSCGGINRDYDNDRICDGLDGDVDGDNVLDNTPDIELDTPLNCKVDGRGKKIDDDGDGICDFDKRSTDNNFIQIDQCLGTTCGVGAIITDYSSSRVGCPKDCASCPTDPSCNSCGKCSTWFADPCSPEECFSIGIDNGGCYYISGVADLSYGASCSSCGNLGITDSSSCSVYDTFNEESCLANQCLNPGNIDPTLLRCEWEGRSTKCENIDMNTYYEDADQDRYGDQSNHIDAYEPPSGYIAAREDGKWDCVNGDNDITIHPDAEELCDGKDNNCDGTTDDSTICACTPPRTEVCSLPQSNSLCTKTCTEQGQWSSCDISRAGQENIQILCFNGQDDDCDGLVDCEDSDCGGNGQTGSGNWDASLEGNSFVCDNFDDDDDQDGINDFDSQGNILDQEQFTPIGCNGVVDAFGRKIDSDGDNVCDGKESSNCKNTAPGCGLVDSVGCPTEHACDANPSCYGDTYCIGKVFCSDCGTFLGLGCSYNYCSSIGDCYYNPQISNRMFGNICTSCENNIDACGDYIVEGDCNDNDPCGLETTCLWNSDRCCDDQNDNGECDDEEETTAYYPDLDGDGYPNEAKGQQVEQGKTILDKYILPRQDGKWDCVDDSTQLPGGVTQPQNCPTLPNNCGANDYKCPICINSGAKEVCLDIIDNNCNGKADEDGCECKTNLDNPTSDVDNDNIPDIYDAAQPCTPQRCHSQQDGIWEVPGKAADADGDVVCDFVDICLSTSSSCLQYVDRIAGSSGEGCPLNQNYVRAACQDDPFFGVSTQNINDCKLNNNNFISCSNYGSEDDCTKDLCKVGNCRFVDGECTGKLIYYKDKDGDGIPSNYGSSTDPSEKRELNIGETPPEEFYLAEEVAIFDCVDNDATVYPGATEICDRKNNDCDEDADEGCIPQEERASCTPEQEGKDRLCGNQVGACQYAFQKCENGFWSDCQYGDDYDLDGKEVRCEDGLDNDCDGNTDCDDLDCDDNVVCTRCEDYENDNDCDDVNNIDDEQPNTGTGCKVDVNGRGVAIDTDWDGEGDGVCDLKKDNTLIDQCPNTPKDCEVITNYGASKVGCPTLETCSNSNCAVAGQKCEGVTLGTGPGPGGQGNCQLEIDSTSCDDFVSGVSGDENGVTLSCRQEDGSMRVPVEIKIIDFNTPGLLDAGKFKVKCCSLKCADAA